MLARESTLDRAFDKLKAIVQLKTKKSTPSLLIWLGLEYRFV